MMIFGLSGSQLFGVGLAVIGMVVLAFSGRYVWRTTGIYRAEAVSTLERRLRDALVRIWNGPRGRRGPPERAPFSRSDCLALRYAVEERRLSPVLLPWFVTIHELAGSDTFRLRTSEAQVDIAEPAHTVTLERNIVATVPSSDEPPRTHRTVRARH